jgi:hypothetical protein
MRARSKHLAKVLYKARINMGLTQYDTNAMLTNGRSRNGQFWSSIERGTCTLPVRHLPMVASRLQIPLNVLKEAYVSDYRENLDLAIMEVVDGL